MTAWLWRVAGLAVVAALIAGWSEIAALKLVSRRFSCRRPSAPGPRWCMAWRTRTSA